MTVTSSRPSARLRQIAVVGASTDVTPQDLENAAVVGRELAQRGFVCVTAGDDGVMGAAAWAAKNAGGAVAAILPRGTELAEPAAFDCVVRSGLDLAQFSDMLRASCCGSIVVGAGDILSHLVGDFSRTPVAFVGLESDLFKALGVRALDEHQPRTVPTFDIPADALDYVVARVAATQDVSASELMSAALALHSASYPFDRGDFYLQAGERFREAAALISPRSRREEWADARARNADALGDHSYYDADDFLQAAAHYGRSLTYLAGFERQAPERAAFRAYLRAILLESVAFGLYQVGEYEIASTVAVSSSALYAAARGVSSIDEHPFLTHSSLGLAGAAEVFQASAHVERGSFEQATAALSRARSAYADALAAHPAWGEGHSSDNYRRSLARITELEQRIARGTSFNGSDNAGR